MKILLISLMYIFNQTPSQFVKGKGYEGYIFNKEHFVFGSIANPKARYTPTIEDIKVAESILVKEKDYLKDNQLEKYKGCPWIYKKLHKYIRQYVGFINQDNEIVIMIDFFYPGTVDTDALSNDIVSVNDGCSNFWSITVNLKQRQLYDMRVNGIAVVPPPNVESMFCRTLLAHSTKTP